MRVLIFRHVPFEGAGRIETSLQARGIAFDYCDLYQSGASRSATAGYAGLIFMGGPMSANDELPFIGEEIRLIESVAARDLPLLGVCLGSQLIARALGGRVYRNAEREIGWFEVRLTEAGMRDPVLSPLAPAETVFHWHSDTFDLPPGAAWLASSARTPHQAYRIGRSIYGIQFHLEVTPAMIVDWSKEEDNCGDVRTLNAPLDPRLNDVRCRDAAAAVFGQWCAKLAPGTPGM